MAIADVAADDIRREMRDVRADLRMNVSEIVQQANDLTDWKKYVKAYPLLSLGAAGLLGYLMIPSRSTVVQPNTKELLELVQAQQVPIQVKPVNSGTSLLGTVARMAGNTALQIGMSALTRYLAQMQQPASSGPHHYSSGTQSSREYP